MSASQMDRDRMGLKLKKIVLNGEEYDIDTHTVPVPGMMASSNEGAGLRNPEHCERSNRPYDKMDKECDGENPDSRPGIRVHPRG